MTTECWFRNPDNYIKELVEVGVGNVAWDRGFLVKKSIDPFKHASLYFGRTIPWRALLIGEQGTAEIGPDNDTNKPIAVYPTWGYGEDPELLQEIVEHPVGEDERSCLDISVPNDERPVWGQPHRVVITDIPTANSGQGRKFLRFLKELQEDNPQCILHVHGLYSWRISFGMGYASTDVEARTVAQKGRVILASGQEVNYERTVANPKWVTLLGFKPADLSIPRNRCMFNIKSALWAAENYEKLYAFSTTSRKPVDSTSSDKDVVKPTGYVLSKSMKSAPVKEGDQYLCDTCSLQNDCKYFRSGAVCSVPGAEPTELARFFKTRDSDMIIDGLGTLMAAQTRRLERGMEEEDDFGLNPEVTKMMGQLFEQGVKLAKLLNPELRGGTKININTGGGTAQVAMGNPRQFTAAIVRELEQQGIPRDKITPQMIAGMMEGMADRGKARGVIEGQVVEEQAS